ncbi:hypothetical protein C7447_101615 [Tenacibaculum adriaticum]|uniref:Uncharacterized protein n=1 Tax=Tenacibaculum adriaticum TaxID=413713 RepID=A0A5S5DY97_9FLAO|nr:hypothetical protein [Tenacibaculum adriaticum]TYQ00007.1 hypothetical protein C7447_101615 [Tenacibaculum adriaticum]
MKKYSEAEVNKLISSFTSKKLPVNEWTHEAHVIVAIWHNWNFGFNEALEMVRSKIISYNESVGTLNTENSGYHETLTVFWMIHTKSFVNENNFSSIEEASNAILNSEISLKNIPFEYYTKEILFSPIARKKWVNGDLKEISLINDKDQTKLIFYYEE